MSLNAEQRRVYDEYGADIVKYQIPSRTLARQIGVTEWTVRRVKDYIYKYGPPEPLNDDRPGTVLVIPDSHAKPGVSNERFVWLGRLINERGHEALANNVPFTVVNIGDMGDMESLSSYDVGKKSFEGRRYWKDIEAVLDAQQSLFDQIDPEVHAWVRWVYTEGNHEHRISRATNDNPALDGLISLGDLRLEEFGWEVYPFKVPAEIHGIAFCHYFPSGVMGRPIGGVNVGRSLVTKCLKSCVQGHSHLWNHASFTDVMGKRIHGMSVGCYFEHEEEYAGAANRMWWRGITILKDAHDGDYYVEQIHLSVIKKEYGP